MLSDKQLEALLSVFDARMQGVTDEYFKLMGEHIRDIGKLSPTDMHRLTELSRMGYNLNIIKNKLAAELLTSMGDVQEILDAAAASDVDFAATLLNASANAVNRTAINRIFTAQLRQTMDTLNNLSQTTIESTAYRRLVDKSIATVQGGFTDYKKAIRSTLHDAGLNGLKVKYPSGYVRRADTAVRQNIIDGVKQLNQKILDQCGEDFGADGVEITAHMLCAEDHLPYQGNQYTKAEFEAIQHRLKRPIGQWNCRHMVFPVVLGISQATNSREDLQEMRRNSMEIIEIDGIEQSRYKWSQAQRNLETAVRAEKDTAMLAAAVGDDALRRECQKNIDNLVAEYKKLSKAAGLDTEMFRMRVQGFRRVSTNPRYKR